MIYARGSMRFLAMTAALLAASGCDYMPDDLPDWTGLGGEKVEKLSGERLTVVRNTTELQVSEAVRQAPFSLPPVSANAEWPQHTGMITAQSANLSLPADLTRRDSTSAGEGEGFRHALVVRPVVAEGRLFAMDAEGMISAHEAGNIDHVLWHASGTAQEDEDDTLGGGLAVESGVLYATSGRGLVVALDAATGNERWRKNVRMPLRSAPKVAAGKLFVTTLDNQLLALSTRDGEVLWTHRGISESAGIMNAVSPTVAGDVLIVPYSSGQIYALSAVDGTEIWSESLARGRHTEAVSSLSGIGGDPVVDDQVVFAVSSGGTLAVYALRTGQRVWERPVGSLNTPWVAGEWLFVMSNTNTLMCIKKFDGQLRWQTALPSYEDEEDKSGPLTWRGPLLADGRLLLVSSAGQLVEVAADSGQVLASREVPEDVLVTPVIAAGALYLIEKDATLHVLQ